MQFNSKFDIGQKAWVIDHETRLPMEITIGQIDISFVDSPGIPGEDLFDNYKPQKKYVERYMAVETGIGSGYQYTLNEHIFSTFEECVKEIDMRLNIVSVRG
jgi:hypothetical protein